MIKYIKISSLLMISVIFLHIQSVQAVDIVNTIANDMTELRNR